MSAARTVLERLLRRAESARLRGADSLVSLPLGRTGEYAALRSLAELEAFHAAIALAERAGAIAAQREGRSGDGSRLLRLTVTDLPALARHLGVTGLDQRVSEAAGRLDGWTSRFPVIAEVLDGLHANGEKNQSVETAVRRKVEALCAAFPVYSG